MNGTTQTDTPPPRPKPLAVMAENIPVELKQLGPKRKGGAMGIDRNLFIPTPHPEYQGCTVREIREDVERIEGDLHFAKANDTNELRDYMKLIAEGRPKVTEGQDDE
jgi:hypothetical protein